MLFHVVPPRDWTAAPGEPYAPASLAAEGFVHCSDGEAAALAVAEAYYREVPGPLLLVGLDEARLTAPVRREGGYPHVYGPVERTAVTAVRELRRAPDGRVTGTAPWPGEAGR
ncbi:DUF952 domain-containing protein [Streptomyces sp. LP05-1]|uniref:DUF952 domain-containing protein n=1 Tax=Streptomyces pyxinae TaxID=2970734 RepID=A0ABT2CLW3_9ACTN|nr:DUF952 domain-containing protein [Streptomyces sp. LP05-1]MCS0638310.1 DUF952 domain-containing protein [Streptomyces sp. LP05-1]